MSTETLFCDNCGKNLTHSELETVQQVPQINPETYEILGGPADVYTCSDCGFVIGYRPTNE